MPVTRIVSWSEISTARQCPMKHELAYKERWNASTMGAALSRGILWHEVLEYHYKLLKAGTWSVDEMAKYLNSKLLQRGGEGYVSEDAELIDWMYLGYLEHYGRDPEWKIKAVEHAPEVWLPTDRGGRSNFKLKLKIDLIVEWKGKLWLVDHKSHKNLPTEKELEFDDQFGLYCWAMRQLGKPIFGCIYNTARTQKNKDQTKNPQTLESRHDRFKMTRTDAELDAIAVEAYKTIRRQYSIPLHEAERNTDTDTCRWKCNFTEPCLAARKGQDMREFLISAGFVQDFTRH